MTARNRLPSDREIERVVNTLRRLGVEIGAVDIREDGVTVYPPAQTPGTAYDRWKAKDANRDQASHR